MTDVLLRMEVMKLVQAQSAQSGQLDQIAALLHRIAVALEQNTLALQGALPSVTISGVKEDDESPKPQ
jgi:hypothetical protein